jgi:DNA (cytosine-5)-methyltransferase 1
MSRANVADLFAGIGGSSVAEQRRGMGFDDGLQLPSDARQAIHLLGNAVCPPVMRDVLNAVLEAA